MSAAIRIKIIGGTDIAEAYIDCEKASSLLGGISIDNEEMSDGCKPGLCNYYKRAKESDARNEDR